MFSPQPVDGLSNPAVRLQAASWVFLGIDG